VEITHLSAALQYTPVMSASSWLAGGAIICQPWPPVPPDPVEPLEPPLAALVALPPEVLVLLPLPEHALTATSAAKIEIRIGWFLVS
jgi:hypothetical protein